MVFASGLSNQRTTRAQAKSAAKPPNPKLAERLWHRLRQADCCVVLTTVSFTQLRRDVSLQMHRHMIEQESNAPARFQIFVHHDPNPQLEADVVGEHGHEPIALGERHLAQPDAEPRAQGGVLPEVAVAAETKELTRERDA